MEFLHAFNFSFASSAVFRWLANADNVNAMNAVSIRYTREEFLFRRFERMTTVALCTVIPVTAVCAALTGHLTAFEFVIAFATGLCSTCAVVYVTPRLFARIMPRASFYTAFTPALRGVGVAFLHDLWNLFANVRAATPTPLAQTQNLYRSALCAPIARDMTLRAEDFFDPISAEPFVPRCIAYVLDDSLTAAVSEETLTRLYGPASVAPNNSKNPFTNLALTRITKVRLIPAAEVNVNTAPPPLSPQPQPLPPPPEVSRCRRLDDVAISTLRGAIAPALQFVEMPTDEELDRLFELAIATRR
jgi:hypothetical protein